MSDDFLDKFLNDPFDNEGGGGLSEDIALVRISFAWQAGKYEWRNDTRTNFIFDASLKESMITAKEECVAYIEKHKLNGFPKLGVLTEIPIDTFLTAHEKMTWDVGQFTNSYFSAKFQLGEKGKLDIEQQEKVKGLLPYDLVIQSINQFRHILGEFVWARLSQEINWYTEAIGQRKNEDYPNLVYVIQEIFENKEAACAAAGITADNAEDDNAEDDFAGFGSGLSQSATNNGWTPETLQKESQNIHNAIASALKGEGTPDDKPMENKEAVKMVCDQYAIKPEDLKLLKVEIAF
jgi:hypothetical protein